MTALLRLAPLALCFVALTGCDVIHVAAQSERARGMFERTLTVNGPVELSVRTGSGNIQIRTGAGDRVQIVGRINAGSSRDGLDPAERVRRVEAAPPITQAGNVIRIGDTNDDPNYRNVGISYELVVPPNTRINAQTGSGNIHADSVGGEVRAQTGSGSVEVRQVARADVSVQTGSGSVTLSLPPDAAYTLDARTGSGSISTAQPLTVQGRIGRNHLTGTVRGGGNNIQVRTGSGSIEIR